MPMVGDLATPLCAALVSILTADATIQSQCGRSTRLVVPFEDVNDAEDAAAEIPLPIIVYTYGTDTEIGGIGDQRLVTLTLDVVAEGNDARTTVHEISAQIRRALTWNAFDAHGLDAIVRAPVIRDGGAAEPEATRGLVIHRNSYTIQATAP